MRSFVIFFEFIILAICKSCRLRLTRADTKPSESLEPPELGESSNVEILLTSILSLYVMNVWMNK